MSANQFGNRFRITTFGESHGVGLGVVIDGCPAGVRFDVDLLKKEMDRRKPGQMGQVVSQRQEADEVEVLSGVFEGLTLGTPLAMLVRNKDARSADYAGIKNSPRAGHADDVWQSKFGHRDYRGGGRSSGRETVTRVMAGAVARMFCQAVYKDLQVVGYTSQVGSFSLSSEERAAVPGGDVDQFPARFPSSKQAQAVREALEKAQGEGNSLGGCAEVLIQGAPANLGQPVFHKLKSDLAQAYLSVGAVNGFELGAGFSASQVEGKEFHQGETAVYGGIRGGISTGENILVSASFKPTSSILDVAKKGRHDPFIVTRAIPVLEAMTWIVLADHILWAKTDKLENFL